MDNMTAKVSCFARAYHHKQNTTHIFDDSVAAAILMDDYDEIAMNMTAGVNFFMPDFKGTKEEGLRLIVDKQLSPSVLARSAYCEGKLLREKEKDCKQYIVFAAGYDTFALRNTDDARKVFELDLPELLEDKKARIQKAGLQEKAIYVPCNLAKDTWKAQLTNAGFHKNRKAFGSLLGISYYLTKEEFNHLLSHISEMLTEGSTLCFDYPFDEESYETKTNRALASGAGEQMKALYSKQEIQCLLEKCGFTLEEHLSHDEMTAAYFAKYNEANPNHPMEAPAGVHYVFARKHI